ncbi:hypothetical protein CRENBAI_014622, partial [Crenichthys baileyi]
MKTHPYSTSSATCRKGKARAPGNATPASAYKRNRADTTEHCPHNRPPDPTPTPEKLTQQAVRDQCHATGAVRPHHALVTTETQHITATSMTDQGETPTSSAPPSLLSRFKC